MLYLILFTLEDKIKKFLACILIITSLFMSSDIVVANDTTNTDFGYQLCALVKKLQGAPARAIATIAIFALGISLFMGKLNWPAALTIAIGIIGVFSADSILDLISPPGNQDVCPD